MSNFPVGINHFEGARNVSPIDNSEGGPPLVVLVNELAQSSTEEIVVGANIDYENATAAVVKAANRKFVTNTGSTRVVTLPVFADAPDGWTQTYLSLDASGLAIFAATGPGDTINGVAGSVALALAHDWAMIVKVPGATEWFCTSAGGAGSVIIPS